MIGIAEARKARKEHGQQMEKVKIPPEADSLSIDGWDINNSQQQAYIQAINRHLIKTVDTDGKTAKNVDTKENEDGESKEEARENHSIIGCGIYYPWVTQTDEWVEALQKAEAATGYRASWHWVEERGEDTEVQNWETTTGDPESSKKKGKKIKKKESWYDKIAKPRQEAYMKRVPYPGKSEHKSPWRKDWEAERQQRFEETLKRHQEMFAELLGKK